MRMQSVIQALSVAGITLVFFGGVMLEHLRHGYITTGHLPGWVSGENIAMRSVTYNRAVRIAELSRELQPLHSIFETSYASGCVRQQKEEPIQNALHQISVAGDEIANDDGFLFMRGLSACSLGDRQSALQYMADAYRASPKDATYGVAYARLLKLTGKPLDAINVEEAILLQYPWLIFNRWFAELEKSDSSTCEYLLTDLKRHFAERAATDPLAMNGLGWLELFEQNYDLAEADFRNALQRLPNLGRAWAGLAIAASQRGMTYEALEARQMALMLGVTRERMVSCSLYSQRASVMFHEPALTQVDPIPHGLLVSVFALGTVRGAMH